MAVLAYSSCIAFLSREVSFASQGVKKQGLEHKAYFLTPRALPQKSGSKCKAYLLTLVLFGAFLVLFSTMVLSEELGRMPGQDGPSALGPLTMRQLMTNWPGS